jgi:hypothetical protein
MTDAIRPFRIRVPDEALVDLRRRVRGTRWPERATVMDKSQCVQLVIEQLRILILRPPVAAGHRTRSIS